MLRRLFAWLPLGSFLAASLVVSLASAQPAPPDPSPHPFSITKADPSLDTLIAPDAKLTTVAGGFGFIDGPVWVRGHGGAAGYLLASSIIDNVIPVAGHSATHTVSLRRSVTRTARLHGGSIERSADAAGMRCTSFRARWWSAIRG